MERKGVVTTALGSKYINKLCKHFTHRVTAEWSKDKGTVFFDMGICVMTAKDDLLSVVCTAETGSDLDEILDTMKRHFDCFAVKDQLVLDWL